MPKINKESANGITVVYVECVLMPNKEVIHFGKSLGFVSDRQAEMVESGACKLTKGSEPVIALGVKNNPA